MKGKGKKEKVLANDFESKDRKGKGRKGKQMI